MKDGGERTDKAIREFISEAQETVEELGSDLLRLEEQAGRGKLKPDLLNAAFRAAHSIKGLSGMFGMEGMNILSHHLEDLLDGLRMGRVKISADILDMLFEGVEILNMMIGEISLSDTAVENEISETGTPKEQEGDSSDSEAPPPSTERYQLLVNRIGNHLSPDDGDEKGILKLVDIPEEVLAVLTEYEEYRLLENIRTGAGLYWIKVSFDLMSFDKDLALLSDKLKEAGEIISTLPSSDASADTVINFDLLFGTESRSFSPDEISEFKAVVQPVRRLEGEHGSVDSASEETGTIRDDAGIRGDLPEKRDFETTGNLPSNKKAGEGYRIPVQAGAVSVVTDNDPDAEIAEAASRTIPAREEFASLKSVAQTVRVDISRLDHLMTIVGELVLCKTNIHRISDRLKDALGFSGIAMDLFKEARKLERRLEELQQGVLEVRMVPLGQVFDKLSRMVRKLAREEDKEIIFNVHGGDTELDKLIIEDLSDPLMHIIRNAIDHGIEFPEVRKARGKPVRGIIDLNAYQKGNHVVIEISDDGAGMDPSFILDKALEKGLLTENQAAELQTRDIFNLIFVPGFSTSTRITDISGRGVGMDVVKTNIGNLSGVIDVFSEPGAGSTFILTLPITLAIIQALVIRCAGRIFAIPLNVVIEILRIENSEIKTVECREVIDLRGSTLPLVRLERLFRLSEKLPFSIDFEEKREEYCYPGMDEDAAPGGEPADSEEPVKEIHQEYNGDNTYVVVVGLAQNRIGIAVDDLVGQHDVVIKNLGKRLEHVRGIAGATDLGDQRTTLVLDVAAIMEEVLEGGGRLKDEG